MEHISLSVRRGLRPTGWNRTPWRGLLSVNERRRCIHLQTARTEQESTLNGSNDLQGARPVSAVASADARFEVLGAPYSLLSATLTPSQNLYTRRGTLVGLKGKPDNVVSTLRVLEPVRRALLQIPFLYQRISSTSPVTALISVRSPTTSFAVVRLDGSVDWMIAQRQALLAWTGHSLSITPTFNKQLSLAHWGNSEVTGRGLLALVGKGQVYSIDLKAGEQYIAHPSNVVAYTLSSHPPRPYRFKSSTLRLQIPDLGFTSRITNTNFIRNMADTDTWKAAMSILHTLRTWSRRTIWGDRLFLQFDGPTRILLQTRGSRVRDVLTTEEVNEFANAPPGVTREPVHPAIKENEEIPDSEPAKIKSQGVKQQGYANVLRDGEVEFKPTSSDK